MFTYHCFTVPLFHIHWPTLIALFLLMYDVRKKVKINQVIEPYCTNLKRINKIKIEARNCNKSSVHSNTMLSTP